MADPGSSLPDGWQHGAFIEIFVRSYQDSGSDGTGDLRGLINRLDYLKDLGVKGIWLMPINKSQDHDHGYAVVDYRNTETDYGSLADFDELLTKAHARGIGVIIDYVMNHSAAQNPLFQDSRSSTAATYRSWYVWQSPAPTGWSIYGGNPWRTDTTGSYFGPFWDQMPDFNLKNTDVLAYHMNSMRFWLNRGTDGFRFDAVGNLVENGPAAWEDQPENYAIMGNVRTMLNGYAKRYMVCEGPADPQGFGAATACGSAFAFDLRGNLSSAASGNTTAINNIANYFKTAPVNMATMASNHDSFAGDRLWDQVGGNLAKYRLVAGTYLMLPGTPFIYYGEEIGMAGGGTLSGDAKLRTPMSWTNNMNNAGFTTGSPYRALSANVTTQNVAAQMADGNSILAFYKAMLALRNSRTSISQGTYSNSAVNGNVLSYQRKTASETTLVVINYGTATAGVDLASLPASNKLTPLYPVGGAVVTASAGGAAHLDLPAQSVQVYSVAP